MKKLRRAEVRSHLMTSAANREVEMVAGDDDRPSGLRSCDGGRFGDARKSRADLLKRGGVGGFWAELNEVMTGFRCESSRCPRWAGGQSHSEYGVAR